ncbi:unnamed protein product [Merluccius merluccius]
MEPHNKAIVQSSLKRRPAQRFRLFWGFSAAIPGAAAEPEKRCRNAAGLESLLLPAAAAAAANDRFIVWLPPPLSNQNHRNGKTVNMNPSDPLPAQRAVMIMQQKV